MSINRSQEILTELGLVDSDRLVRVAEQVRDRDDVGVLKDSESGIIFLDRSDHVDISHYESIGTGVYWNVDSRDEALKKYALDDGRRFEQFKEYCIGKRLVDVGCGTGGFLDRVSLVAQSVAGVEPQSAIRAELDSLGYEMYEIPSVLPEQNFEVVTLFHTLEHLVEPIETLKELKRSLVPGGKIIVEVPHARDALLALPDFQKFTFWSEHLILHTKSSLTAFLTEAGFKDIVVEGYQRYPLSNHLGWLVEGKPGGQASHSEFDEVQAKYTQWLKEADKTDTLIATAEA